LTIGFIRLFDTARDYTLQFTIIPTHTDTSPHSHVFTSRCLVAASNGRRSFLWVPELSPASATSFSQQPLTTTKPQLYSTAAVETRLFAKPLLSNDFCIFAYLAVFAQQRVYISQYFEYILIQHEPLICLFPYHCSISNSGSRLTVNEFKLRGAVHPCET
jgi:hypothetical protein